MTDIEMRREQTIHYAEYFKNYELSLSKHQYDQEMNLIQDEYEVKAPLPPSFDLAGQAFIDMRMY